MSTEAEQFLGVKSGDEAIVQCAPEVSLRKRVLMFSGAWLVALLSTCPSPEGIGILPFFPVGLAVLMHLDGAEMGAMVTGWIVYLVFGILILTARRRRRFRALFIAFIILLLLNVAGCHVVLRGLSHIN